MTPFPTSRRHFLAGAGSVGAGALLSSCVTQSSTPSSTSQSGSGPVTLQSNLSSPQAKTAMQAVMAAYGKRGGASAQLNTVASETFRTQLPTYLTSANPPDVYTWYPGSVAEAYAKKGLLLDLSDLWQGPDLSRYSSAMRDLCTSPSTGKQDFVPTDYYWWGFFYRKSNFAKWGVHEPTTWDEFLSLCRTLKDKGVAPIGLGAGGGTAWVASAWFDYLNIRVNGADYHRELLAGKHSFNDPQVHKVFDHWGQALPFFDPNGTALAFQDATTALLEGRTGMMLIGTFFADAAPKDALGDIDFFRFPVIDPKVPLAEEAPVDGFFASAHSRHTAGAKELMAYLATAEAQELYIKNSSGTVLPAHPDAKDNGSPLVAKGRQLVASAKQITQFFNRDSSDALQPTADTALVHYLSKPKEIGTILTTWQRDAQQIWSQ